jgi:hypothetical protein
VRARRRGKRWNQIWDGWLRWKGNGWFTLGEKNILRRCLIPLNSPSVETERQVCKDWSFRWFSQNFWGPEPPKIFSELPKFEFQRQLTSTPFEILNFLSTEILRSWYP